MRRIAPYLLAAVLIAFIVSLAYFGTQRGSGGGGGGGAAVVTVDGETVSAVTFDRAYRAAVEQTRQMAGDRWTEELPRMLRLREQVVERLIDERLVAQGAAREGIAVSDAELVEQITRIGAFQEGGRFSRDRYVRLLAMTQPPMTPGDFETDFRAELVRQRLQALIADGRQDLRGRGATGLGGGPEPRARGLPPGRGRRRRGALGDRRRDRRLLQGASRRVHPAGAPARPGGDPAGRERAGAGRHRCRRRGGVQGPPQPVRAAGPHEGLARPDQGARGRRQRGRGPGQGPGRDDARAGSAAAPISPRWRGRRRRIPRRRAAAATSA